MRSAIGWSRHSGAFWKNTRNTCGCAGGKYTPTVSSKTNKLRRTDANDSCVPLPFRLDRHTTLWRSTTIRWEQVRNTKFCWVGVRLIRRGQFAAAALGVISNERASNPHSQLQLAKMFEVSMCSNWYSIRILTIHPRRKATTTELKKMVEYGDWFSTPLLIVQQKRLWQASREYFAGTDCLHS